MRHPDEGTLTGLLDGELDSTTAREVRSHLDACPDCTRLLDEIRNTVAEADRLLGMLDSPAPKDAAGPPRMPVRTLAYAASLLLAAGVGYWASELRHPSIVLEPTTAASSPSPAAAAGSPASAPETRRAPPAADLAAGHDAAPAPSPARPREPAVRDSSVAPPMPKTEAPGADDADRIAEARSLRRAMAAQTAEAEQAAAGPPLAVAAGAPVTTPERKELADAGRRTITNPARNQVGQAEKARTSVLLIPDLTPQRIDLVSLPGDENSPVVRVVYRLGDGRELWLEQFVTPGIERDTLVRRSGGHTTIEWTTDNGTRVRLSAELEPDSLWRIGRRIR